MEEERKDLYQLATEIAPFMNLAQEDWRARKDPDWPVPRASLVNGEREELHLTYDPRNPGRIKIRGGVPHDLVSWRSWTIDRREKTEITLNAKKTAREMAREIERRLLPPYLRELAYCEEQKRADEAYKDGLERTMSRVVEIVGSGAGRCAGEKTLRTHRPSMKIEAGGQADAPNLSIEIRYIPVDLGLSLLRAIRAYGGPIA